VLLKVRRVRERKCMSTCIDDDNVELLRFSVEICGNEYNCAFGLAKLFGFSIY